MTMCAPLTYRFYTKQLYCTFMIHPFTMKYCHISIVDAHDLVECTFLDALARPLTTLLLLFKKYDFIGTFVTLS